MANKYLFKRGIAYYSRFTIPLEYRIFFKARELRWSLKTSCEKQARAKVYGHREIFLSALRKVHGMEQTFDLTLDEMKQIQESLNAYMQEQLRLFRGFSTGTAQERDTAKQILSDKASKLTLYESALESGDFSETNGPLSDFLEYPAVQRLAMMFDQPSDNFRWFAELACTTEIELFKKQQSMLIAPQKSEKNARAISLSEAVNLYLMEKKNRGLTEKSINGYRLVYDRLIDYLDDKDIHTIERSDIVRFQSALKKHPAKLSNDQKGLPIRKLIEEQHDKTLHETSINKHLTRASELFSWLKRTHKTFTHNPAEGLSVKSKRKAHEERSEFSNDQIKSIFEGIGLFQGIRVCSKSAHYWGPLIAAYTGMRIEEICQLDAADIRKESELWVFDVNDNDEKRLKTKSGKRLIPVHSKLIELGILEYRDLVDSQGHKKLFPTLIPCKINGYSHNPSKWFSRQKTKIGLKGTTEVFHSFRHTVSNALKQNKLEAELADQITGHSDSGLSEGRKRYAKPYPPQALKDAIESLCPPIEVVSFKDLRLGDHEKRALGLMGKDRQRRSK